MKSNHSKTVLQLTKIPTKDKGDEVPHIQVTKPNTIQQCDLLFLPNDKGFQYLLVVVDCGSRLTDAIPLRTKTALSVLNAFKKIYEKNKILKLPYRMDSDSGSEFKGVVKKWLNENGVYIRYGKPDRSQQQALAEKRNQEIGTEILLRQLEKEILTNKVSKQWISYLPDILEDLNKKHKRKNQPKPKYDAPILVKQKTKGYIKGDRVRVIVDKPINYFGKKLTGNFRSADIRWSPTIYQIDKVLMRPNYPIMYLVKGLPNTPYTYNQLQKVD